MIGGGYTSGFSPCGAGERFHQKKPLDLLEHAINATTFEGDIVLDCFSGSGSTGVASTRLNRLSILMEIDPKWCNYASNKLRGDK